MRMKDIGTIIVSCCLPLFLFVGCDSIAEGLAEGGKSLKEYNPPEHHRIDVDGDDSYWRMEWEKEKLRRLEEQQRLEGARIRAHTQKMLKQMELERKLREQR